MTEEDIAKTAIITPFDLFEFPRMPFGPRNAGATFQRFIDSVLSGLSNTFGFVDDIVIASDSLEEHYRDLDATFRRLKEHGLKVSAKRCVFAESELNFLGYRINQHGITIRQDRVESLTRLPAPKGFAELRRYVGMFNFYRALVPKFAEILYHLQKLLNTSRVKGRKFRRRAIESNPSWVWDVEHEKAFTALKQAFADTAVLHHPSTEDVNYAPVTDASSIAYGAAFHLYPRWSDGAVGFAFQAVVADPAETVHL